MEKVKKLFGSVTMSWKKVILFAVIAGVITGISAISIFNDSSFQDLSISFEGWILFAVFIISNCKTWKEAALKTFVFFLISQPIVYLTQVPFSYLGWQVFQFYPKWFFITLLTLPGAVVAFQIKRKDWLSVAVIADSNGFFAYAAVMYLKSAFADFPHHLVSGIFCIAAALLFILLFTSDSKKRIVSFVIFLLVAVGAFVYFSRNNSTEISLGEGSWTVTLDNENVVSAVIDDDTDTVKISAIKDGTVCAVFTNENGEEITYYVTVSGGNVYADIFE